MSRRQFCFNFKVYSVLVIGLILYKQYMINRWFMVLACCSIFPQVIHFAAKGFHLTPDYNFVYIFLLARFLILVRHPKGYHQRNVKSNNPILRTKESVCPLFLLKFIYFTESKNFENPSKLFLIFEKLYSFLVVLPQNMS